VILVDANILTYSHVESFAQHQAARAWLDQQLNGTTRVGLPCVSLVAFLRLVTNPRVFERPEPAHLAALALEHGLTLCSTDGDFARFPALRWINPLAL
jgi:predicted nucleic acid-binding protein